MATAARMSVYSYIVIAGLLCLIKADGQTTSPFSDKSERILNEADDSTQSPPTENPGRYLFPDAGSYTPLPYIKNEVSLQPDTKWPEDDRKRLSSDTKWPEESWKTLSPDSKWSDDVGSAKISPKWPDHVGKVLTPSTKWPDDFGKISTPSSTSPDDSGRALTPSTKWPVDFGGIFKISTKRPDDLGKTLTPSTKSPDDVDKVHTPSTYFYTRDTESKWYKIYEDLKKRYPDTKLSNADSKDWSKASDRPTTDRKTSPGIEWLDDRYQRPEKVEWFGRTYLPDPDRQTFSSSFHWPKEIFIPDTDNYTPFNFETFQIPTMANGKSILDFEPITFPPIDINFDPSRPETAAFFPVWTRLLIRVLLLIGVIIAIIKISIKRGYCCFKKKHECSEFGSLSDFNSELEERPEDWKPEKVV